MKKRFALALKKHYVTVSENNCRCHQMEQSEMRPHWHDLEYTMKLQPQIPYKHKNLLYLSVNTMYSYMEFILLSEYQMRAEGRGGVGIPRCENTNLYFM